MLRFTTEDFVYKCILFLYFLSGSECEICSSRLFADFVVVWFNCKTNGLIHVINDEERVIRNYFYLKGQSL